MVDNLMIDGQRGVVYSPSCSLCKNLLNVSIYKCKAFKDNEIPLIIWNGKNKHKKPFPNDNGIQFERVEKI